MDCDVLNDSDTDLKIVIYTAAPGSEDAAGRVRLGVQADREQWADELTSAVLDHHAAGFIYRSTDDTPAGEALARWPTEVVPAVREAITR